MKVLEITGEPISHGGQEKFIANLIDNMGDPKIQMDVLTPYYCDNTVFVDLVKKNGGTVFEMGKDFTPGKSRRFLFKDIKRFLAENKYDIVHIHSGSISVLAYTAKAAKETGIKKRIVHSHCTSTPSLKHKIVKFVFGKMIEANANVFLACSEVAGEDKYPKNVVENKMVVISNGIKTKDFKRNDSLRSKMKNKMEINDKDYILGSVGRFSFQKNTPFLLDIFEAVNKKVPNTKLLLVGDGELRELIEKEIQERHLDDSVILVGNVEDVASYYQVFDVFLLPSRFEGLPFVAIEAQASGVPCIISTGVTKEAVICENVKMIPLDCIDEWSETAVAFMRQPVTDNYAAIISAGYDIKNTISQIKAIYSL